MWNDPRQLNRLSAWILLLAGIAAAAVAVRALTEGLFPLREVTVLGARQAETQRALRQLIPRLKGGFFSLDLEQARLACERLPWVRQATVRRLWPNRLLIEIEEHVPAAAWNGQEMLSIEGVRFPVRPWAELPRVHAPDGFERLVARRLNEFTRLLAPSGWRIASLQVSPRGAWRLVVEAASHARHQGLLSAGAALRVSLELGRDRHVERVNRFLTFYDATTARLGILERIDLRYPNGFAVRLRKAADSQAKTAQLLAPLARLSSHTFMVSS